jgi:hypothetical protein
MATQNYRYGILHGRYSHNYRTIWMPPPPISPKPNKYENFLEKLVDDSQIPVMQRIGDHFQNPAVPLYPYYDRQNGRVLWFLQNVVPPVLT